MESTALKKESVDEVYIKTEPTEASMKVEPVWIDMPMKDEPLMSLSKRVSDKDLVFLDGVIEKDGSLDSVSVKVEHLSEDEFVKVVNDDALSSVEDASTPEAARTSAVAAILNTDHFVEAKLVLDSLSTARGQSQHKKQNRSPKHYQCSECSFTTCRKASLESHKQKHNIQKTLVCDHCHFTSSTKTLMIKHLNIHREPYKCSHCSYTTHFKLRIKGHAKKHTGSKQPYKCDQCEFATHVKLNLKHHKFRHSGEKPHKCSQCSYACTTKYEMK